MSDSLDKLASTTPARKPTKAERLQLALSEIADSLEAFESSDGRVFVVSPLRHRRFPVPLESEEMRMAIRHSLHECCGLTATKAQVAECFEHIRLQAQIAGRREEVFTRVGWHEGGIALDLGGSSWRVVVVDAAGWRVTDAPPVYFHRPQGMRELPEPVSDGGIYMLEHLLNLAGREDLLLVIGWLLSTLGPDMPRPLLVLHGAPGTGKSTAARMLMRITDPSEPEFRSLDVGEHDIFIAVSNVWVLAVDNVSRISRDRSDLLCRIATGGGFAVRRHYTDAEEVTFSARRPVILNGIENHFVDRADLLDRSIIIDLPDALDGRRRVERNLWDEFSRLHPYILGGLLDAVSCALSNLDKVGERAWPRMADFAQWVTAAEPSLGLSDGTFLDLLHGRAASPQRSHEDDPVLRTVIHLLTERSDATGEWSGTCAELLDQVLRWSDKHGSEGESPSTPSALGSYLKRLPFHLYGVQMTEERKPGGDRERVKRLTWVGGYRDSRDGRDTDSVRPSPPPSSTNSKKKRRRSLADPRPGRPSSPPHPKTTPWEGGQPTTIPSSGLAAIGTEQEQDERE